MTPFCAGPGLFIFRFRGYQNNFSNVFVSFVDRRCKNTELSRENLCGNLDVVFHVATSTVSGDFDVEFGK